jgi:hypothetical protein
MTAKNVTNLSEGTITLPNGPSIPSGRTVRVENWGSINSNAVVQGQVDAGVLLVEDAPVREHVPHDAFKATLRAMTKAELAGYINARGKEVVGDPLKEELMSTALALPRIPAAD